MKAQREPATLALGLMSGTSADGIDVALVRIASDSAATRGNHQETKAYLENFATLPFPPAIRAAVLRVAEGHKLSPGDLSQLNFRLGQVFAGALLAACRKFRVHPKRIGLIGSHGQTVYHQGTPSLLLGERVASTLQIGEPAVIAALTGITTVGDFRPADMAVGGQGAPLVPWVDYRLYRHPRLGRAALNIGGIANVTVIPPGAESDAKRMNSDLDKGIESNLDAALIKDRLHKSVKYAVKNHVVTLTGDVDSQSKRALAEQVASAVLNVQQVVNELQVKAQKATSSN